MFMEEESSFSVSVSTVPFAIFAASILLHYVTALAIARKRGDGSTMQAGHARKTAPEAGGSWPLLGHLHLLGGPAPRHLVLAQMAESYGPIFTIWLGVRRALVVSAWEIAKECLNTKDRALATRPRFVCSDLMTCNYAMIGLSPYGPYWREDRKISTLELPSNHRIGLLQQIREEDVLAAVRDVCSQYRRNNINPNGAKPVLLDMKRWFGDVTLNIIFRIIVGRMFDSEGDEEGRRALRSFFELTGRFVVVPFLRWLDLGGYERAMRRTAKELDRVGQGWLEEHKARRKLNRAARGTQRAQDFMDVMLSLLEDNMDMHER